MLRINNKIGSSSSSRSDSRSDKDDKDDKDDDDIESPHMKALINKRNQEKIRYDNNISILRFIVSIFATLILILVLFHRELDYWEFSKALCICAGCIYYIPLIIQIPTRQNIEYIKQEIKKSGNSIVEKSNSTLVNDACLIETCIISDTRKHCIYCFIPFKLTPRICKTPKCPKRNITQ